LQNVYEISTKNTLFWFWWK